jgi:hypothetical protein
VGPECFQIGVVEGFDGGVLDGPVHPLGLTVRPWVVGFGEPVLDAVLLADPVEDVAAEEGLDLGVAAAVLGQIGKGHAVVREHGVQLVGEDLDHLAQEGGTVGLGIGIEEGDVGELGYAVDREEHEQLALSQAQLADVDVDIADLGCSKALAPGRLLLALGQPRDAVADEAAMQGAARELGDGLAQAAQDVVQRQQRPAPELDHDRLFGLAQDRAARPRGSHRPIRGRGALAPFGDRLRVQPVAGGQVAGRLLRRLELGSNSRRRAG